MTEVIIYGSGSLAREIFDFELSLDNPQTKFIGYINDFGVDLDFEEQTGLPRLNVDPLDSNVEYLICIADPVVRFEIYKRIKALNARLYTYIHPTALISKKSMISEGCILYPYVVVSANAHIGRSVVLNTYSGVGHDVSIQDCCTISAHVDLMGYVKVGECCFLGSGARVLPSKKIGRNSKIGAGITVIRSLKEYSTILPLANKVYL